jgi:EAL domain-containing protein (putative c-di-GMP-specific phosphodiesterase class I)
VTPGEPGGRGEATSTAGRQLAVGTAVFAWEWARTLVGTSWVPDDRTVVAERLRLLTERAVEALLGNDQADVAGREIGAGVVTIGFAAPEALGRTLQLMTDRLLADLELPAAAHSQLTPLLSAVAVGFSRASRDRTLSEQDAIRSSYLVARERAEQALRKHVAGQEPDAVVTRDGAGPTGRTGLPRDRDYLADFPAALERGDIVTYYQPIVTLADGELIGTEALARWRHPRKGLLRPADFLPTDAAMLSALGHKQREDACRAAARWQEEAGRPIFVGVNLAPPELREAGLVDDVRAVLDRAGLDPELLHLEITEDAILGDADLPTLRGLSAAGVRLTLDDFGTGVSRLAALPTLPVQGLKIASALLDPLRHLPFDAAQIGTEVLVAVVSLANRLGLTTTIEGVETEAEAGLARRLGVQRAQGWLYGRPVPAEEISARFS